MEKYINLLVPALSILFIFLGYMLGNFFGYFLYAFAAILLLLIIFSKLREGSKKLD